MTRLDLNGHFYTSGQIHDFVIDDICKGDSNKTKSRSENKIKYQSIFESAYGYCDIYDKTTSEIWEVKRFSSAPSCQFLAAEIQLQRYLSGTLANNPNVTLQRGGSVTDISPNVFTEADSDGQGVYVIGYFDTGVGVIYYDYMYIPSGSELAIVAACVAMAALAGYAGPLGVASALVVA